MSRQVNQETKKRPLHSDIVPPQCAVAAKPHKVIMVMFIGDTPPHMNALSMSLYISAFSIFLRRQAQDIVLGAAPLSSLVDAVSTLRI
jgi:heme O synthase-like polyprenyltransferase